MKPVSARHGAFDCSDPGCDSGFGEWNSKDSDSWDGTSIPWDGHADPSSRWSFHYPTIVRLQASGSVTQTPGALEGDHLSYGPDGTGSYGHQAAIGLKKGVMIWFAGNPPTDIVQLQGDSIYPLRTPLNDPQPEGQPWWTCGKQFGDTNHPCWAWSGNPHLDYAVVPVQLTLTPTTANPERGSDVTFTASMDSLTVNGIAVDMRLLKWRFATGSGVIDTMPCMSATGASCTLRARSSGTLSVRAYVNGKEQEASAVVEVRCSTGNPVLDDADIRRDLKSLMSDSRPDLEDGLGFTPGGTTSLKRERGGDIYRSSDGQYYFIRDTQMLSNECFGVRVPTTPRNSTDIKVGDVHTHPNVILTKVYGCADIEGTKYKRYPTDTLDGRQDFLKGDEVRLGGGSPGDWTRWRLQEPKVDAYVMTNYKIWWIKKEKFSDDYNGNPNINPDRWLWTGTPDSCNW